MMVRIFCSFIAVAVLCGSCRAAEPHAVIRQEAAMKLRIADSPSHFLRATHILVIRFERVNTGTWERDPIGGISRVLDTAIRLVEVAKGSVKESPGSLITTKLKQFDTGVSRIAAMPGAWSQQTIEPGAEFLVVAVANSDSTAEIVQDPACQLAILAAEALTDLRLASAVEDRGLEISAAASLAKEAASKINFLFADYFWARYSAAALADHKQFTPIAELLEQPGLNQAARGTLISRITTGLTTPEPAPEKQLARFAISLFRLLALAEARSFHDNIVGTYLPAVVDLGGPNNRPASAFLQDFPQEKNQAIQILSAYRGAESVSPLLEWLRR
jgi:hypothetical protein